MPGLVPSEVVPRADGPMDSAFETAFVHAPIGMALVDMSDRLLRVNDALCRITGYTTEQFSGRTFRDLSHPQDFDVDASEVTELIGGRMSTYYVEKRFQHARGHPVWVLLSVALVRDDEGRPLHRIAQVQDISGRKAAEEALEPSASK